MNPAPCQHLPLQDILVESCDPDIESQIQDHLDGCPDCQQRLADLAADRDTWDSAHRHLSTLAEWRTSSEWERRLTESSAFVVPTSEFSRQLADSDGPAIPIEDPTFDWRSCLDPPRHPEMVGQIDQFEIESKLGQGGMGLVLKGFDRELDRPVAIKVLSPHLASHGTARQRFAREAQAAAAVVNPHVVPIYSVNQSADRPYLVMQLVSGESLQALVESKGPLDPRDVVRIAIQIADGLSAAHHQGLIHRDVKPANVLTERDASRVMITDFGLARAVDDAGMTQTGWLTGTPHYMSPEQARGDHLDAHTDLFSLGSLMYFLATGREPFRASRPFGVIQKIINTEPLPANAVVSEVPATLNRVILKLLEKDAEDRFATADEVRDYLRDYLAYLEQPTSMRPPRRIETTRQARVRRWIQWTGLAALATTILSGAYFFSRPPSDPTLPDPSSASESSTTGGVPLLDDQAFLEAFAQAESDLAELERWFEVTDPLAPASYPTGGSALSSPTRTGVLTSPQDFWPIPALSPAAEDGDVRSPPNTDLPFLLQGKNDDE